MSQAVLTPEALFVPANFVGGRWSRDGDGTFCTVLDKYYGTTLASIPHAADRRGGAERGRRLPGASTVVAL